MPFPLIPVAIGSLIGLATAVTYRRSKKRGMTPERKSIYDAALNSLKDADGLERLGNTFIAQGLTAEGELLLKRATLRRRSDEEKEEDNIKFREALKSQSVASVNEVADFFDSKGATGAAATLRNYAKGLDANTNIKSDQTGQPA